MRHAHRASPPHLPLRRIGLAAIGAAGFLAGCTAQFTEQPGGNFTPTMVQTSIPGIGPVQLDPATGRPLPQAAPPANLTAIPGNPLPPPSSALGHDGNYNGWAELLGGPVGPNCATRQRVSNFRVKGDRVQFGGFRGRIDQSGSIQMARGSTWITGQFTGAQFNGSLTQTPAFNNFQGCSYRLVLDRS